MDSTPSTTTVKSSWLRHLKQEWFWIAPLTYAYLCAVGMVDAWKRFDAFGIRIFEFSEPGDFIVAPFREPNLIVLLLLIVVFFISLFYSMGIFAFFRIPQALSQRLPEPIQRFRQNLKLTPPIYILAILIVLSFALYGPTFLLNGNYDENWKRTIVNDPDRYVEVAFARSGQNSSSFTLSSPLVFIGSNSKYFFFYCESTRGFVVSPSHNIVEMRRVDPVRKLGRLPPAMAQSC